MPISINSVLWGIGPPQIKIYPPVANTLVATFDLPSPNLPVRLRPETLRRGPTRVARNLFLRHRDVALRWHFELVYLELTAAQAQQWTQIYNYHINGFRLYFTPHTDYPHWQLPVIFEADLDLGYLADKFIAHTLTVRLVQTNISTALHTAPAAGSGAHALTPYPPNS